MMKKGVNCINSQLLIPNGALEDIKKLVNDHSQPYLNGTVYFIFFVCFSNRYIELTEPWSDLKHQPRRKQITNILMCLYIIAEIIDLNWLLNIDIFLYNFSSPI